MGTSKRKRAANPRWAAAASWIRCCRPGVRASFRRRSYRRPWDSAWENRGPWNAPFPAAVWRSRADSRRPASAVRPSGLPIRGGERPSRNSNGTVPNQYMAWWRQSESPFSPDAFFNEIGHLRHLQPVDQHCCRSPSDDARLLVTRDRMAGSFCSPTKRKSRNWSSIGWWALPRLRQEPTRSSAYSARSGRNAWNGTCVWFRTRDCEPKSIPA